MGKFMRKILLITAATSSFLMAAHHQHSDMTQQAAWAATQSYYAPVPGRNNGVWINGTLYTKEGLENLRRMAENQSQQVLPLANPYFQQQALRAHLTPPSPAKLMPPEETPWERLEKACRSMGLVLPQDVKVKAERPIQSLETDAAGSELNKKVWAHITLGYARQLAPFQAKQHFLEAIGHCSKKREFAFEWKVATIGLINSLFETREVLRALFLLQKFGSNAKNMVKSKRLLILSAISEGWEDKLRETEWIKQMDGGYPDRTIAEIRKAITFFEKELYPDGKK